MKFLIMKNKALVTMELLVLAAMFVFSQSVPQNYYNPYSIYGYYPYRRSGYSRKPQTQTLKRQSAGSSSNSYSQNLFNALNASIKTQNEYDKVNRSRVSKADQENAKFAGANNQESDDESTKTAGLLLKTRRRCLPFGRDASTKSASSSFISKEQGRFLFDLNVYNVYPNGGSIGSSTGYGCGGGYGGGLLGGGLLSDVLADSYAPPATPLQNFLTLFAPGILQNALAATVPPRLQTPLQSDPGDVDPGVDPNYNPRPLPPVRRPNRIYYDSAGAAPITPAQLVGGVATTVNGIIQQLTGNVQPVYPG